MPLASALALTGTSASCGRAWMLALAPARSWATSTTWSSTSRPAAPRPSTSVMAAWPAPWWAALRFPPRWSLAIRPQTSSWWSPMTPRPSPWTAASPPRRARPGQAPRSRAPRSATRPAPPRPRPWTRAPSRWGASLARPSELSPMPPPRSPSRQTRPRFPRPT